jgi:hypothetical protein
VVTFYTRAVHKSNNINYHEQRVGSENFQSRISVENTYKLTSAYLWFLRGVTFSVSLLSAAVLSSLSEMYCQGYSRGEVRGGGVAISRGAT